MSLPSYYNSTSSIPSQPDYAGLQLTNDSELEVRQPDDGKIFTGLQIIKSSTTTEGAHEDKIVVGTGRKWKRWPKRYFVIASAVIVLIIVVAGVLSYVLRTRVPSNSTLDSNSNPNSTNPETKPNDDPVPNSTVSSVSKFISQGSHMSSAAWSWKSDGEFTRFLLYQDPQGSIRYFLSSGGNASDASSWAKPGTFHPTYTIANGTSITTTTLAMAKSLADPSNVQLEVFYLNQSSYINGMPYRSSMFGGDGINNKDLQALPGSSLAAYWPYIIMQTVEGTLQLVKYDNTRQDAWIWAMLPERAMRGSELAIVPISRDYTNITTMGRYVILYQDEEGQLTGLGNPANATAQNGTEIIEIGWFWSFPKITLPDNGTFAAVSIAASTDESEDTVDTFILFQDDESVIQHLWRDGQSGGWSSSTPKAFTGADKETKIACVTTLIWNADPGWGNHPLAPPSDLTRCFFQKNGKAMETLLDGTDWKEAQEVPVS